MTRWTDGLESLVRQSVDIEKKTRRSDSEGSIKSESSQRPKRARKNSTLPSLGNILHANDCEIDDMSDHSFGSRSESRSDRSGEKMDQSDQKQWEHPDRLARKAEWARASRRRKKTYVQNLEETVADLKRQLAQPGTSAHFDPMLAEAQRQQEQRQIVRQLKAELCESQPPRERIVSCLLDRFQHNARARIFNVDFHIDSLTECLANGPEDALFAATRPTNVPAVDLAGLRSRVNELSNVVKSELKRLNESSQAQIARSSSFDVASAIVTASSLL